MDSSVAQHRPKIADSCRRYHVQRLEVFGSVIGDRFDLARSDLDFLVEFQQLTEGQHSDTYFGLLETVGVALFSSR